MADKLLLLREVLKKADNNYSKGEIAFHSSMGVDLVNQRDFPIVKAMLPSITIIIPYFESPIGLEYTLKSLNYQEGVNFKFVDVIIIDDGSVTYPLRVDTNTYKFEITIIRLRKNRGRVRARNIGLLAASGEVLMFLDSDMYLSSRTLYNHLAAHKYLQVPAILTGFREWVNNDDSRLKQSKITNKEIDLLADFRAKVKYDLRHLPYLKDKSLLGKTVELVTETNNYKDLGHYRSYLGNTLPGQIHGFLFSLPHDKAIEAGPVGETAKGWGSDDLMLTSRFIAAGCYVIPLLNAKGLHLSSIDGERCEAKLREELDLNRERYHELQNLPYLKFYKT